MYGLSWIGTDKESTKNEDEFLWAVDNTHNTKASYEEDQIVDIARSLSDNALQKK